MPLRNIFTKLSLLWAFCLWSPVAWAQEPVELNPGGLGWVSNGGQWPEEVLAMANVGSARIWMLPDGFRFSTPQDSLIYACTERFVGATHAARWEPDRNNHAPVISFYRDRQQITGVAAASGGWLRDVYPGVDLRVDLADGGMKTTWHCDDVTSAKQIGSQWEGVMRTRSHGKHFMARTPAGMIELSAPVAQDARGRNVKVRWRREGDVWRPEAKDAVVIDPNYRFSTFSGSVSDNFGYTATYDGRDRTWLGGIAFGANFPTQNGFQNSFGGNVDIVLMLIDPTGTSVVASTFVGGSGKEQPNSLRVDDNGDLVVLGVSNSTDFPMLANSWDTTMAGGPWSDGGGITYVTGPDIVVFRLDSLGSQLKGATFVGGSGSDGLNENLALNYGDESRGDIVLTPSHVIISSSTRSFNFPVTNSGNLQGNQDGVLFALSPMLDSLKWSTYAGGTTNDALFSLTRIIGLNGAPNRIATVGATTSDNLATAGALHTTRQGLGDGWVATWDESTGQMLASTYYGSTGWDYAYMIFNEASGSWMSTGDSNAIAFTGVAKGPMTSIASAWTQPNSAQFVTWMNADLDTIYRQQLYGDSSYTYNNISTTAFSVDACGSTYLSGWGGVVNLNGTTHGLYTTPNAFDTVTDGSDFYFLVLDADGMPLYASFFGGQGSSEHVDGGTSRFDPSGVIHQAICAGCGGNSLLPVFPHNAYSTTNASSNCNMAGVQIAFQLSQSELQLNGIDSICVGIPLVLDGWVSQSDSTRIYWGDSTSSFGSQPIGMQHVYTTPGWRKVVVHVWDTVCKTWAADSIEFNVSLPLYPQANMALFYDPCDTSLHVELHPTDSLVSHALYVLWGDGTDHYEVMKCPMIHDYHPGNYGPFYITLVAYDTICGLADTAQWIVNYRAPLGDPWVTVDVDPCQGPPTVELRGMANYATDYFWHFPGDTNVYQGNQLSIPTDYGQQTGRLIVIDSNCRRSDTLDFAFDVAVENLDHVIWPNTFTPNGDGHNDTYALSDAAVAELADVQIEVYTRYGQVVFRGETPDFAWDGTHGGPLPSGVYFYIATWTSHCGAQGESHGTITLNRKP